MSYFTDEQSQYTTIVKDIEASFDGDTKKLRGGFQYPSDKKGKKGSKLPDLLGKDSLINDFAVLHYSSFYNTQIPTNFGRVNPNDYFTNSQASNFQNPTGTNIVNSFSDNSPSNPTISMSYKHNDFLFIDKYGKVSNNYLITLRRFPGPVSDDIRNPLISTASDIARVCTYLGEDNSIESIVGFTTKMNWEDFESEINTVDRKETSWGNGGDFANSINNIFGAIDTTGRSATESRLGDTLANYDPYTDSVQQKNNTWGPIDVIDKIKVRKRGIEFEQKLTVTFTFKIRSFAGLNTRAVFLDILGNIMTLTSNKAPFWGGANRLTGAKGYAGPIGDLSKFHKGDDVGFLKSVMGDLSQKISAPFSGPDGLIGGLKTLAGNLGSQFLGGQMDKLGRPQMTGFISLLQGKPTGEWHLTVGNPFQPILMIGNLCLMDSKVGFQGPLTADDVPSVITLTVELDHGMPRDKYGIQQMFNFGRGRFYGSELSDKPKTYYRNRSAGSTNTPQTTGEKVYNTDTKNATTEINNAPKTASNGLAWFNAKMATD